MLLPGEQRCERLVDDFRRDHIAEVRGAVAATRRPALAAERGVAARFAIDGVHTETADQRVVTDAACQRIVADAATDRVIAAPPSSES